MYSLHMYLIIELYHYKKMTFGKENSGYIELNKTVKVAFTRRPHGRIS